jgi:hypothetical protein
MLASILSVSTLAIAFVWIIAELRLRAPARILIGCLLIVSASSSIWALKDLEHHYFSFWVTQAFEVVSAQVEAGNDVAVHRAIARYAEQTRNDPSIVAAVELIHELDPKYGAGSTER